MSVQPSQSSQSSGGQPSDRPERRFSALIGSLAGSSADRQPTPTRPTFTARTDAEPAPPGTPEPAAPAPQSGTATVTGLDPRPTPPAAPVPLPTAEPPWPAALPHEADGTRPGAPVEAESLLGDEVAGLRGRWQRLQAGFVDDPELAVGDAADLIEQTAQALVGALRQQQRALRVMWERGPADDAVAGEGEPAPRPADTEHLRLMMQRYRTLFNQLCRP
jgi:hypothetical protein